jgi:hypothetical protein
MQKRGKTKVEKESEVQVDMYKNIIDAVFDGWDTIFCSDSFDAFTQLLNTWPPQYAKYAGRKLIEKDTIRYAS